MTIDQLIDHVRAYMAEQPAGVRIKIVADDDGIKLTAPRRGAAKPAAPPVPGPAASTPFTLSALQESILEALDGKTLRVDALGAAVGDRSRLYKPRGLRELRDRGLVCHDENKGFYRPDSPPETM